ncbi:hypothetical protein, partial [Klebsiella pneumoniae]|uniref:hypothetical protein n=1 Tax=Klebsiella pneumoniae TaxID=573 RepID=UPI001F4A5094
LVLPHLVKLLFLLTPPMLCDLCPRLLSLLLLYPVVTLLVLPHLVQLLLLMYLLVLQPVSDLL